MEGVGYGEGAEGGIGMKQSKRVPWRLLQRPETLLSKEIRSQLLSLFSGPLNSANSFLLLPDPRSVLPEGSFFSLLAPDHALAFRSCLCKTQFPHLQNKNSLIPTTVSPAWLRGQPWAARCPRTMSQCSGSETALVAVSVVWRP